MSDVARTRAASAGRRPTAAVQGGPPPGPAGPPDDLAWVGWLRFAAITAVVLIHVAGLTAVEPGARDSVVGRLAIALDFSSRWAVPVFVMLSGALLLDPARYAGPGHFLRRRVVRLVPPLVVWHAVYLAYRSQEIGPMPVGEMVRRVIEGQVWTAMYFFWIVVGLAVVTPVLLPWVASASRRAQTVAALVALSLPVLSLLTAPLREDPVWVLTAWTWFLPYLGYYLLGWVLRGVVLRGPALVAAVLGAALGSVLLAVHWRRSVGLPGALERYAPAESYFSPVVVLVSVCVLLAVQGLVRPGAPLRGLSSTRGARLGRRLGDVTLGVFAVHLLVLEAVLKSPVLGGPDAAGSVGELVARVVTVLLVSYAVALVAARTPLLRRLV